MKPYPFSSTNDEYKKTFHYQVSKARRVVENAFGHLKASFRRLGKGLENNIKNAALIIKCCCVLHNFLNEHNDFINSKWQHVQKEYEKKNYRLQPHHEDLSNDKNPQAEEIRKAIADYFEVSSHASSDGCLDDDETWMEIDPLSIGDDAQSFSSELTMNIMQQTK
ncbi:uncharacterized protein LOC119669840 [Teleopsis dalmanni]|uniref:uncharacterized protein LOC119669840 n=1 Tax=Teleopsis dalmanni TaxID=139649 RepID=UPI0018CE4974|nr:uncharacterized protein LOC119669840 [Teleopsis dalmanni]